MTFFWTTKLVKFEKPSQEFLKALTLPAFLHAFGHCLSNVSFATVAVSFTHTVKTLEPVFSAVGVYLVSGTVYPLPVYLALIPVIEGTAIDIVTGKMQSGLHRAEKVNSYIIKEGELIKVSQRIVSIEGMHS